MKSVRIDVHLHFVPTEWSGLSVAENPVVDVRQFAMGPALLHLNPAERCSAWTGEAPIPT